MNALIWAALSQWDKTVFGFGYICLFIGGCVVLGAAYLLLFRRMQYVRK